MATGCLCLCAGACTVLRRAYQHSKTVTPHVEEKDLSIVVPTDSKDAWPAPPEATEPPLDLVICMESSSAVNVESFRKSVAFLDGMVRELEMPPNKAGILRFGHGTQSILQITSDKEELLCWVKARKAALVQGEDLAGDFGPPKMAPPLRDAGLMLQAGGASRASRASSATGADYAEHGRRRAVLVVTAGSNFEDLAQAEHEAAALRAAGVPLHFVHVVGGSAPSEELARLVASHSEASVLCLRDFDEVRGTVQEAARRISGEEGWALQVHVGSPSKGLGHVTPERDTTGPPSSEENAAHLQMEAPPPKVAEASAQTEPMIKVSLEPWRHAPLDLVVCVDSSASFCLARQRHRHGGAAAFTESGTFERAKAFVEVLAGSVNMPEVQLGLIRFEDFPEVASGLTDRVEDFWERLRALRPSTGETRLAPALSMALSMLERPRVCGLGDDCVPGVPPVRAEAGKAVLVVTDGDPGDVEDTWEVAAKFRASGTQLLFVKMLKAEGRRDVDGLRSLAVPCSRHPRAGARAGETQQVLRGVFEADDEEQALKAVVPEVLRQLLSVSRRVARARCSLSATSYEEVSSVDAVEGHDVLLGDGTVLVDPTPVAWEPGIVTAALLDQLVSGDGAACRERSVFKGVQDRLVVAPPSPSSSRALPPSPRPLTLTLRPDEASAASSSRDCLRGSLAQPRRSTAEAEAQTGALVKVELLPWRHAPLDLVVCIDASASSLSWQPNSGAEGGGSFVESGAFRCAKSFAEQLAASVQAPEVRLGLLRFDSSPEVLSELASAREDFLQPLRAMAASACPPRLGPALLQALSLLGLMCPLREERGGPCEHSPQSAGKAVLVLTSGGEPSDAREAAEAAAALKAQGAQLIFVKISQATAAGDSSHLSALAGPLRPPRRCGAGASGAGDGAGALAPRGVFEALEDDEQSLQALLPQVLQQLIGVTRRIARARCAVPLEPWTEEAAMALDGVEGHEVVLPEGAVLVDPRLVAWEPGQAPQVQHQEDLCQDLADWLRRPQEPAASMEAPPDERTEAPSDERAELSVKLQFQVIKMGCKRPDEGGAEVPAAEAKVALELPDPPTTSPSKPSAIATAELLVPVAGPARTPPASPKRHSCVAAHFEPPTPTASTAITSPSGRAASNPTPDSQSPPVAPAPSSPSLASPLVSRVLLMPGSPEDDDG